MRLRTLLVTALLAGFGGGAFASEADEIEKAVTGGWKNPAGGSCQPAYLKAAQRIMTSRGEQAMGVVLVSAGATVNAQVIIQGAREGQVINPMTDKAILLVEPLEGDKLHIIPVGPPALGSWPEVTLELCPGSR